MLLWTLTIGTIYMHVPHKGAIGFILNPDVTLSYNQYFWMIGEHLIMIVLALIIWDEARDYKDILWVFVLIQIADVIAFMLSYNDPLRNYIITWNILKTLIFGAAIAYRTWKK